MNPNARILVVDDDPTLHEAYSKILSEGPPKADDLDAARALFMGEDPGAKSVPTPSFRLAHAHQGVEAIELVRNALEEKDPFRVVFLDVRMPPGLDGVETAARLWELDPSLELVLCTAYSDYSHTQTLERLGRSHRLLVLKKPFEPVEVRQMAHALAEKAAAEGRTLALQEELSEAAAETRSYAASLVTANKALSLSKLAAEYGTRVRDEILLEVTEEAQALVTDLLGPKALENGPGAGLPEILERVQSILASLHQVDPGTGTDADAAGIREVTHNSRPQP